MPQSLPTPSQARGTASAASNPQNGPQGQKADASKGDGKNKKLQTFQATVAEKLKYLKEALAEETQRREAVEQQAAENAQRRKELEAAIEENQQSQQRFQQLLDELLQRAESGDVAAMQELGRRLNRCSANVLRHGHADIEDRKANLAQAYVGNPEDFRANLRRGLEEDQRRLDECEAVPEPLRSSGVDWLEKAAATGSGTAQLVYVQEALYEFTLLDEHQAVAQIDEFLRRRDLARRFLAEAMTHCVPDALRTQLDFGKYLFERKDPRDYAINRAAAADALLREYRAQGAMAVAVENMQGEFDYLAKELDAPARAAAQRRGEAMFNTCAPR